MSGHIDSTISDQAPRYSPLQPRRPGYRAAEENELKRNSQEHEMDSIEVQVPEDVGFEFSKLTCERHAAGERRHIVWTLELTSRATAMAMRWAWC